MIKKYDVYYTILVEEIVIGPFAPHKRELCGRYDDYEQAKKKADNYNQFCKDNNIWEKAYVIEHKEEF